jgi:SAM-dependent methyltransferase
MQKLNLGCGSKKLDGFVNIDINKDVNPDKVVDLEKGKLPFKDDSVDHVVANFVLEYIGEGFLPLLKEIYRVCESGAIVEILATHPRHDDFLNDPRHKRPITLNLLKSLGKKYSSWYKDFYSGNTGVAEEIDVDFEVMSQDHILEDDYLDLVRNNKTQEINEIAKRFNNVFKALQVKLVVMK